MNQLPQVNITITFVSTRSPRGEGRVGREIVGAFVDIGEVNPISNIRQLEVIISPPAEDRDSLSNFLDSMDIHNRMNGRFDVHVSHGEDFEPEHFLMKVESIRSIRNGPFIVAFASTVDMAAQNWWVRNIGAYIPGTRWRSSHREKPSVPRLSSSIPTHGAPGFIPILPEYEEFPAKDGKISKIKRRSESYRELAVALHGEEASK